MAEGGKAMVVLLTIDIAQAVDASHVQVDRLIVDVEWIDAIAMSTKMRCCMLYINAVKRDIGNAMNVIRPVLVGARALAGASLYARCPLNLPVPVVGEFALIQLARSIWVLLDDGLAVFVQRIPKLLQNLVALVLPELDGVPLGLGGRHRVLP